jgi:hypothetical protein
MTVLEEERGVHDMKCCVIDVRSLHFDRGACSKKSRTTLAIIPFFYKDGTHRSVTTVSQSISVCYIGMMGTLLRLQSLESRSEFRLNFFYAGWHPAGSVATTTTGRAFFDDHA